MFIKDGDSGKNENLFGKVRECLCLWECERRQETLNLGGRRQKAGRRREEGGSKRQAAEGRRQTAGGRRQEAGGRRRMSRIHSVK